MNLHMDEKADALYLRLEDSAIIESEQVAPGVILDFNEQGVVVGIEILSVSQRARRGDESEPQNEPVGARGASPTEVGRPRHPAERATGTPLKGSAETLWSYRRPGRGGMTEKQTGTKAATSASKVLSSKADGKASKTAAASALTQKSSPQETTGKKAAAAASKVLRDGRTSKDSKSAAGSALSQVKAKKGK